MIDNPALDMGTAPLPINTGVGFGFSGPLGEECENHTPTHQYRGTPYLVPPPNLSRYSQGQVAKLCT
jgi:hypothetical protein